MTHATWQRKAAARQRRLGEAPELVEWLCCLKCRSELFRDDGQKFENCPNCGVRFS